MKTLRILSLGMFLMSTCLAAAGGCSGATVPIGSDDGGSGGKASCSVDGTTYAHGQSFSSSDGCNTCGCDDGVVACTTKGCVGDGGLGGCSYDGKTYAEGATFPSSDGCNTCGCSAGQVACTARACADAGTCDYRGATYAIGETFKSVDGCNDCTCTAQGVGCTKRACLDAGPDAGYRCPPKGTYDCMPIVPPQNAEICSQPYRSWVQQNCPDVKYVD
jgi:hypothetical protein